MSFSKKLPIIICFTHFIFSNFVNTTNLKIVLVEDEIY